MYRKILVPVDIAQLDRGEAILHRAEVLSDPQGEIVLLNVVEDLPSYLAIDVPTGLIEGALKEAREKLTALKAKCASRAHIELRTGQPAREILAAAEEHSADLVIIASHRPDLSNYIFGSTADRVVRHAACAVLVDR
ncbi:universal stress protein [Gellertiella hungarica]|uniref:Nucleotide-binding universal stress UspA family protein n=1 Tax=Gellertiella hungarica TaxID=1572859 RepID=A0A7W6J3Z8_9HYPH|nr:universal stress protein [Gellertiella hungarica]MBB4063516.1 nucleotide-binding universal stress UspA family protein [Gellertiella hungarica]